MTQQVATDKRGYVILDATSVRLSIVFEHDGRLACQDDRGQIWEIPEVGPHKVTRVRTPPLDVGSVIEADGAAFILTPCGDWYSPEMSDRDPDGPMFFPTSYFERRPWVLVRKADDVRDGTD